MLGYRYDHFHRKLLLEDMRFLGGPGPGEAIPDFELHTTAGGVLRRSDLLGVPVLISFGSITCPMTATSKRPLERMYREFGGRVRLLTVYVREAHPGERYPQAATLEEKLSYAQAYQRRDGIPWTVAVDDPQGSFHRQMDPKPNSFYLMAPDGTVAFRGLWSNDEHALRRGLQTALTRSRPPGQIQNRLIGMLRGVGKMDEMLDLSGPTARRDVARQAPPLYAMARLASLFKPFPPLGKGVAAIATIGVGVFLLARGPRRGWTARPGLA